MYKYHIELNTVSEIGEFVAACSEIQSEVIVSGKDENGSDWSLSAKSFLCTLVMTAHLQNKQKHTINGSVGDNRFSYAGDYNQSGHFPYIL